MESEVSFINDVRKLLSNFHDTPNKYYTNLNAMLLEIYHLAVDKYFDQALN